MPTRARSVRTEIIAGFATLVLAFGGAAAWSFARQQEAVAAVRLANETYLLLTIQLNELRVNQIVLNDQLDHILDVRDRVNMRNWITLSRRSRRGKLSLAVALVRESSGRARAAEDVRLLRRAVRELQGIDARYEANEPVFEEFFRALAEGRSDDARGIKEELGAREIASEDVLLQLIRVFHRRIGRLSDAAEQTQRRSAELTLAATLVACLLGVATAFNARRALEPLSRLRDRARAVARGDLAHVEIAARPDEIGELAVEFERMVGAVKARDEALRKANEEKLQGERLAAIGRMAAHVTHEVRNPLSSMALNAEMLADEVSSLGEEAREPARLVRAIQKEIDRLTSITEEYLRVARLPRPRLERDDLATVVSDAVTFVQLEMESARVTVNTHIARDLPAVLLDEAQVRQVLLNLLRNAREAMEAARVETRSLIVRVERRAVDGRDGAVFTVADSGPGLSDEVRAHLFELFYTTKERGSGLGLPLTREILRAHGATIDADRAPPEDGGGARFTVWFPAAPEGEARE